MLYRFNAYDKDGHRVYSLDTTDLGVAGFHYRGAEVNPDITRVDLNVDYNDGKGWQPLRSRNVRN